MHFHRNLREMFELAPSLVAITEGQSHVIVYANLALRERFGHESIIGRHALDVVESPEDRKEIEVFLDTVFESGAPLTRYAVSMARQTEEGQFQPAYFDTLYHPLRDGKGNVTGIFVEGHPAQDPLEGIRRAIQTEKSLTESRGLTQRQRQVFACLVEGLNNKQTAYRLGISERTSEMHRAALLNRLGVSNTAQLIGLVA